ncbi:MAG: PDZ domain-containing protein [Gammaproteobacteria bacterium]|nr:PDZ domain-containing protein [Gammaproteobacteria bacterium]
MASPLRNALILAALLLSPLLLADPGEAENATPTPLKIDPLSVNIAPPNSGIFMAQDIRLYEAQWQGMDTMNLDSELRQKMKYPKGLRGVIVNEVTLNAAMSGMLGGDIIIAVEGNRVNDLQEFQDQSRQVERRNHAALTVLRKTDQMNDGRYIMNRMVFVLRSVLPLGFAQVESAPMIMPGEPRPHPERGPCTHCHTIGDGRFTMPDPDLITLPPPAISKTDVTGNKPPHNDRGPCLACHTLQP